MQDEGVANRELIEDLVAIHLEEDFQKAKKLHWFSRAFE